jgi:hypothetical protein
MALMLSELPKKLHERLETACNVEEDKQRPVQQPAALLEHLQLGLSRLVVRALLAAQCLAQPIAVQIRLFPVL